MSRKIKGLASLNTLRTRKRGSIPGNDQNSNHLQLYILENNKALLEKELASVLQRKATIEEKMRMIDENMTAIKGITPEKKPREDGLSCEKEQSGNNPVKSMKIEY
jgi:hypothetical protein